MFRLLLATFAFCLAVPLCNAQSASPAGNEVTQTSSAISAPDAPANKPTALLSPALDLLSKSVMDTHLERWKSSVRDETDGNLQSIERDLQNTLPPLLQTADAAPNSISASFPVLRNLDALVAVLLRITLTARGTAPQNEADALNNSLKVLEGARRSLGDQLEQLAATQEKQIADLQSTLKTQAANLAAAQPAAPAATPPSPATKPKRSRKTSKPQQPAPAPQK